MPPQAHRGEADLGAGTGCAQPALGQDFVSDALSSGRWSGSLTLVDDHSRVGLAIEVETLPPGRRVVRVLELSALERALPASIVVDHGPEFTSLALDQWAHGSGVQLAHVDPGRPTQRASSESFKAGSDDECLSENSPDGARRRLAAWRDA